jgi:phenylalanyl-tRNA synthetase beta chain
MRTVLRALGAQVTAAGAGAFRVVAPSHRFDLQEEIDLIEEVARLTGYDAIPSTLPAIVAGADPSAGTYGHDGQIRDALRAVGFHEMVTLSLVAPEANRDVPGLADRDEASVPLANPLSSDAAEMRRSLLPGLLQALAENERQGEGLVAGFSLGRVYGRARDAYVERPSVGLVLAGRWPARHVGANERSCDFPDLKGALEALLASLGVTGTRWEVSAASETSYLHPGKAAAVVLGGTRVGVVGALHPDLVAARGLAHEPWVAELDLQKVVEYCPRRFIFRPLPRFPAVQRDVAVVVDVGFQAQQVLDAIGEVEQPLVEAVRVFDQYTGAPIPDGKKSLAYTVSYRAPDRTLTDDEVNAAHQQLVERLVQRLSVEVRR